MRAYLVRHAEAVGQADNSPLSQAGEAQAEALAARLGALRAGPLYTSPFLRAQATIAPYAQLSAQRVTVLEDLRERRLSASPLPDWQAHIARSFDDQGYAPPGGESFAGVRTRMMNALRHVVRAGGAAPCVVSHGNAISALFSGCDPDFGYDHWRALGNPDVFEVEVTSHSLVSFARLSSLPDDRPA